MKKVFALFLALTMTLSLAACGQKTDETPKTDDVKTETPAETPAADVKKVTMKFAGSTLFVLSMAAIFGLVLTHNQIPKAHRLLPGAV